MMCEKCAMIPWGTVNSLKVCEKPRGKNAKICGNRIRKHFVTALREIDDIKKEQNMNKCEILKKYFGYDSLREGQEELIDQILSGRDVLGIMPTGAGKSLCYQIPALMLPGITLVVSPLISLMTDQVKALNQAGIHAAYINSSLTENQIAKALDNAKRGQYKISYVAPERLETERFLDFAFSSPISMVTVDEAHCISQWGQDFRPSYVRIISFIERLGKRPVISAFTATATSRVKEDILCILKLDNPKVLITGFDRENLFFKVIPIQRAKEKEAELLSYVREHSQDSGIIYCATRKNVELVWEQLNKQGILAGKYHAGLTPQERKQNQDDFIYDVTNVMVATNAFGMGIDKSNVRYVLHYNMPQSLENYYQEAGRAGRDGEEAECILYYSSQDVMINRYLLENKLENSQLDSEDIRTLRENDEQRLKKMSYYCQTRECLRYYILNYFGEKKYGHCEKCGNCQAEYEEKDVTKICVDILQCIQSQHQRYGMNVVVDTLLGRNKAKIRSLGQENNPFFGKQKDKKESFLKSIINELEQREYLLPTKDKYMILKLSRSCESLLSGEGRFILKISREEIQNQQSQSQSHGVKRTSDILTSKGLELFDALRVLRLAIAKEEAVPPYIICTDKTLTDMCVKCPCSKEEMLNVNGIGENKYEKYGQRFLQKIQEFTQGENLKLAYEEENTELFSQIENSATRKAGGRKAEFFILPEMEKKLVYTSKATISDVVKQLNESRPAEEMKAITTTFFTDKLVEEGYLRTESVEGRTWKRTLPKGEDLGIYEEKRVGREGQEYHVLIYPEKAQRFLVDSLKERWLKQQE